MIQLAANIPDRVRREIIVFARQYGVKRVLLFGSRARGTHTERSDIDLAVSGGDFDSFYWDVKENTHTLLSFDLVNLDKGISKELEEALKRDGVIIYEEA